MAGLAGRLRDLEGEYECLALGESRALARLQGVLELLDMFIEPPVAAAPGFLAVRMLGAFELEIDGRPVTHWRGQRTQSLMQFLAAAAYRSCAQALNCEFGVTPAAQTSRVYHQIRAAEPAGITSAG